jgi:hypothetical protein
MIGVNMHEDRATVERFVEKNDLRWPQISGEASARLIQAMGVFRIPAEVIFDQDGVVVGSSTGWTSGIGSALFDEVGRAVQKAKKLARTASPPMP